MKNSVKTKIPALRRCICRRLLLNSIDAQLQSPAASAFQGRAAAAKQQKDYNVEKTLISMMAPPGGDAIARFLLSVITPTLANVRHRLFVPSALLRSWPSGPAELAGGACTMMIINPDGTPYERVRRDHCLPLATCPIGKAHPRPSYDISASDGRRWRVVAKHRSRRPEKANQYTVGVAMKHHLDGAAEARLAEYAATYANDCRTQHDEIQRQLNELELRRAHLQARLVATKASLSRASTYSPLDAMAYQCPRCWIMDAVASSLMPIRGSQRETRLVCSSCKTKYTLQRAAERQPAPHK